METGDRPVREASFCEAPVPESRLEAVLPPGVALTITEALRRAREAGYEVELGCADEGQWAIEAAEWRAELVVGPRRALDVFRTAGRGVDDTGGLAVAVSTHLPPDCLEAFRAQVVALHVLAPDATCVYDTAAQRLMSPAVIHDMARVRVPPPPRRLYSVHAVRRDGLVWLHTHGLRRCGGVEVEMIDVPESREADMRAIMDAAAARLVEEAAPPSQCEAFEVSPRMRVTWVPWKRFVEKRRVRGPGGHERDEAHVEGTGVLMARASLWRLAPPHQVVAGHPTVLVSATESQRMAAAARARWTHFRELVAAHHQDEAWAFLVKVRSSRKGACGEHRWLTLESVDDEILTGQACTQRCGPTTRRAVVPVGRVSDFRVRGPEGSFGPDDLADMKA